MNPGRTQGALGSGYERIQSLTLPGMATKFCSSCFRSMMSLQSWMSSILWGRGQNTPWHHPGLNPGGWWEWCPFRGLCQLLNLVEGDLGDQWPACFWISLGSHRFFPRCDKEYLPRINLGVEDSYLGQSFWGLQSTIGRKAGDQTALEPRESGSSFYTIQARKQSTWVGAWHVEPSTPKASQTPHPQNHRTFHSSAPGVWSEASPQPPFSYGVFISHYCEASGLLPAKVFNTGND